jgi:hypothetical protein
MVVSVAPGQEAWPPAAAALHACVVEFESADLTAEAFRDRAIRILEELSASSPHAAEFLEPALKAVREAPEEKLAMMAGPLAAGIGQIAQSSIGDNQYGIPLMGP